MQTKANELSVRFRSRRQDCLGKTVEKAKRQKQLFASVGQEGLVSVVCRYDCLRFVRCRGALE